MTKQQSCVPWTADALDRVVSINVCYVFAAAGGVLIGITATLEA